MRGMRGVGGEIVQHRVDGRRDRLELREAGKDRTIADLAIDYEGRALRHLERVKIRRAGAGPSVDLRRTRSLQQLCLLQAARLRANFRREIPIVRTLAFAFGSI